MKWRHCGCSRALRSKPLGGKTTAAAHFKTRLPSGMIICGYGSNRARQKVNCQVNYQARAMRSFNVIEVETIM